MEAPHRASIIACTDNLLCSKEWKYLCSAEMQRKDDKDPVYVRAAGERRQWTALREVTFFCHQSFVNQGETKHVILLYATHATFHWKVAETREQGNLYLNDQEIFTKYLYDQVLCDLEDGCTEAESFPSPKNNFAAANFLVPLFVVHGVGYWPLEQILDRSRDLRNGVTDDWTIS